MLYYMQYYFMGLQYIKNEKFIKIRLDKNNVRVIRIKNNNVR